jgi:hypothetical protein
LNEVQLYLLKVIVIEMDGHLENVNEFKDELDCFFALLELV